MVPIRKDQPGTAPGYSWETPGAVVEVDDELAQELLRLPGFSEVQPEPEAPRRPRRTKVTEPAPEPEPSPGE